MWRVLERPGTTTFRNPPEGPSGPLVVSFIPLEPFLGEIGPLTRLKHPILVHHLTIAYVNQVFQPFRVGDRGLALNHLLNLEIVVAELHVLSAQAVMRTPKPDGRC